MKQIRKYKAIILGAILALFIVCPFMSSCQTATYYSDWYVGKPTASGDIYRHDRFTCASNDYPLGTILRIYYKKSWIDVRVNDRMEDDNVIDLSKVAFMILADTTVGRLRGIRIEIIKK